jgi:transcription initiation factor TFIID subunit 5
VHTGSCVRFLTGHKGPIYSLAFSIDGRFLATGGADKQVMLWDIAQGTLVAEMKGHTDSIYTLAFSRDGNVLASGGADCCVKIWDVNKLLEDTDMEDINITHNPPVKTNADNNLLLGSYPTKATSVLALHFTRRNLLKSAGMYLG